MEQAEKQQIKEKILVGISVTEKDIKNLEELTKPIAPDNAIGRLSRMEAISSKSVNEAALRSARDKLARLKYTFSNIDKPDFGFCKLCEEPIPLKRILAVPESSLCVNCAE